MHVHLRDASKLPPTLAALLPRQTFLLYVTVHDSVETNGINKQHVPHGKRDTAKKKRHSPKALKRNALLGLKVRETETRNGE